MKLRSCGLLLSLQKYKLIIYPPSSMGIELCKTKKNKNRTIVIHSSGTEGFQVYLVTWGQEKSRNCLNSQWK